MQRLPKPDRKITQNHPLTLMAHKHAVLHLATFTPIRNISSLARVSFRNPSTKNPNAMLSRPEMNLEKEMWMT